jgi:hypothetical protein
MHTREGDTHSYAPVDVTPVEMARLMNEIRSDAFQQSHPVMQAAYAHYAFVVIHPFADGNGRVSRALASAFTYRAISMPIMILSEHRNAYLDALEAADRGEYQQFVDFMLARALDTMTLVQESFTGLSKPAPEDEASAIDQLYVTKGGYTQDQVDKAGQQLIDIVLEQMQGEVSKLQRASLRGKSSTMTIINTSTSPTHRLPIQNIKGLRVEFETPPPGFAKVYRDYALWLPRNAASDDDILLALIASGTNMGSTSTTRETLFSVRMDELVPSVSGVLRLRIGLIVDRLVQDMLSDLKTLTKKAMQLGN